MEPTERVYSMIRKPPDQSGSKEAGQAELQDNKTPGMKRKQGENSVGSKRRILFSSDEEEEEDDRGPMSPSPLLALDADEEEEEDDLGQMSPSPVPALDADEEEEEDERGQMSSSPLQPSAPPRSSAPIKLGRPNRFRPYALRSLFDNLPVIWEELLGMEQQDMRELCERKSCPPLLSSKALTRCQQLRLLLPSALLNSGVRDEIPSACIAKSYPNLFALHELPNVTHVVDGPCDSKRVWDGLAPYDEKKADTNKILYKILAGEIVDYEQSKRAPREDEYALIGGGLSPLRGVLATGLREKAEGRRERREKEEERDGRRKRNLNLEATLGLTLSDGAVEERFGGSNDFFFLVTSHTTTRFQQLLRVAHLQSQQTFLSFTSLSASKIQ